MNEELAHDDNGNRLSAFYRVAEETRFDDAPLTASLVALWHTDRLLLVFNRYRQCWELPGGMIDPGETPRQAAVRELREETGIHLEDLTFVGYARFKLGTDQHTEYAALYTAQATPHDNDFTPNKEISATYWWNQTQPLTGRLARLDLVLGHLVKDACAAPTAPAAGSATARAASGTGRARAPTHPAGSGARWYAIQQDLQA